MSPLRTGINSTPKWNKKRGYNSDMLGPLWSARQRRFGRQWCGFSVPWRTVEDYWWEPFCITCDFEETVLMMYFID